MKIILCALIGYATVLVVQGQIAFLDDNFGDNLGKSLDSEDIIKLNKTVVRICHRKYIPELQRLYNNFLKEVKNCNRAENFDICLNQKSKHFKLRAYKIFIDFHKCMGVTNKIELNDVFKNIENLDDLKLFHLTTDYSFDNDLFDEKLLSSLEFEIEEELKGNQTEKRICCKNYLSDIRQAFRNYRKSKKACKNHENKNLCTRNVRVQLKSEIKTARQNFRKCLKAANLENTNGSEFNESDIYILNFDNESNEIFEEGNVNLSRKNCTTKKVCWRKYRLTFFKIFYKYNKAIKACNKIENKLLCLQNAKKQFRNETMEAGNQFRKCIAAICRKDYNSNTEDFESLENINQLNELEFYIFISDIEDNEIVQVKSNDINKALECKRKYDRELQDIRQNLYESLRKCQSSENRLVCIRDAVRKSIQASLEVANKIKDCILS